MLHNHSHNRLIILSEFTKIDPAGLLSIKYDMSKEIERRFNWIIELINEVFEKDILKLNKEEPLISNASNATEEAIKKLQEQAFDFNTSEKKVEGFMDWLEDMEDLSILEKTTRSGRITAGTKRPWSDVYVQSSYQKGIFRARREMESAGVDITKLDNDPNREVDLLFNRPFHADRAAYLYTRTFNELKGITKEMDRQLSNILSQGIVDGKGGKAIAKEITSMIPKIGINRARTIARTEIQRAHHQANINEYMNAQIQGVVVLAEWENGANPCPICSSLSGEVFTLEKIRGLIPQHPNCVCVAIPFQPGIDSVKGAVPSVAGWLPNCSEVMHDVLPSALQRINMYVNEAKSCLTSVDKKKVEKEVIKNEPLTNAQLSDARKNSNAVRLQLKAGFDNENIFDYMRIEEKGTSFFTVKTIFKGTNSVSFSKDANLLRSAYLKKIEGSRNHNIIFDKSTKTIHYSRGIKNSINLKNTIAFKNLEDVDIFIKTGKLPDTFVKTKVSVVKKPINPIKEISPIKEIPLKNPLEKINWNDIKSTDEFATIFKDSYNIEKIQLSKFKSTESSLNVLKQLGGTFEDLFSRFPKLNKINKSFKLKLINVSEYNMNAHLPSEYKRNIVGLWSNNSKLITLTTDRKLSNTLTVGEFHVGGDVLSTARHEFGHRIYDRLSPKVKKEWLDIHTNNPLSVRGVSQYATTNELENFAESFSAYTSPLYKESSKKLPKVFSDYFDKLLGE